MKDLKISMRLGIGFGVVIALMLITILMSLMRFGTVAEVNERFVKNDLGTMEATHSIGEAAREDA
ncbi:MAG: hypothetical protein K0S28_751, partial [Paucimonas sp.]|nr:hypothetical protein [Paucimonas sp.]